MNANLPWRNEKLQHFKAAPIMKSITAALSDWITGLRLAWRGVSGPSDQKSATSPALIIKCIQSISVKAQIFGALLFMGISSEHIHAEVVTVTAGQTFVVKFEFQSPFFDPTTPDLLQYSIISTVGSNYTGTASVKLFNGGALLGASSTAFRGNNLFATFKSATSTWPESATIIDFSSIIDRSIRGRIEVLITSGTFQFDTAGAVDERFSYVSAFTCPSPFDGSCGGLVPQAKLISVTNAGIDTPILQPRSAEPLSPLLVSSYTGTITKRNLVVLVHGWNSNPKAWAESLARKIVLQISNARVDGKFRGEKWMVGWYDWHERAGEGCTLLDVPVPCFGPLSAFTNAYAEGLHLGHEINTSSEAPNGWDHVHFIAHSAGSNLVQVAAAELLANSARPPNTIQMTFLDAYYPSPSVSPYGLGATWAEQYVDTRDPILGFLEPTNRPLSLAYDFNVTHIDNRPPPIVGNSIEDAIRVHAWPYLWYGCVLDSSIVFDLDKPFNEQRTCQKDQLFTVDYTGSPYGPKLALEYGDSDLPISTYPATARDANRLDIVCELVTGSEDCPPFSFTLAYNQTLELSTLFQFFVNQASINYVSPTGTVTLIPAGTGGHIVHDVVYLATGSPAFVEFRSITTEPFDTIQLDYQFLSLGKGLLSVYVDDKMVFLAEEVDAGNDVQQTPLIPVGTLAPGIHTLGLRLDPQTTDQSIVEVSGIKTGIARLEEYENQPPLAVATAPSTARLGSVVALDGTSSYDPDNVPRPLGYSWKQVAGPFATLNDWFVASPTFTASKRGQYAFTLTVTDGLAFATSSQVNVVVPKLGDIDLDGDVDGIDISLVAQFVGTYANGPNDLRDISGDGRIDKRDVVLMTKLCTRPKCATE